MASLEPFKIAVEGGMNTQAPATLVYPDCADLQNTRWDLTGNPVKRSGFAKYGDTAMADVAAAKEAVTGIFDYKLRDTTTRYTIVCTPTRVQVCPTTGAWTVLKASISGPAATDYWDGCVFNNKLVLTVPGAVTPIITGGTAATTYNITQGAVWQAITAGNEGLYGDNLISTPIGLLCVGLSDSAVLTSTQKYDPAENKWTSVASGTTPAYGTANSFVSGYEKMYSTHGVDGGVLYNSCNEFDYVTETWKGRTSAITQRAYAFGFSVQNRHFVGGGYYTPSYISSVEAYDPASDTWATMGTAMTAAKGLGVGYSISNNGYTVGGQDATATDTNYQYNPILDTWTAKTAITAAKTSLMGGSYSARGKGYAFCGSTTVAKTGEVATGYSYDQYTNAWTAETDYPAVRYFGAGGVHETWLYVGFGRNQATAKFGSVYRYNVSYAAPQAHYCCAYKSYLFLGRDADHPSRIWYSLPGDEGVWYPDSWMDIEPDDGDWLTGIFAFNGRLYASKIGTMYQIYGNVFDPEEGDHGYVQLEGVPGATCRRGIVVTDHGVYYWAKDGIRFFDGANSVVISDKVDATLAGYVQAYNDKVAGVWNAANNEVWFSVVATGTTHNATLVYNYEFKRWTRFVGINASSQSIVEDANDNAQLLFGTASTTDGFVYKANSTEADNTAAIDAYIKTGWFSPVGFIRDFGPRYLWLMVKRSGAWNLDLTVYKDHGTTAATDSEGNAMTNAITLLSGTYPDSFFHDGTDQRTRITLGSWSNCHAMQLKLSNATASQPFEVYAAILEADSIVGDTYAPGQ